MALSGQVEVPNYYRISCLDSSLCRASACGAGGRKFAVPNGQRISAVQGGGGSRPARDRFISALS
jgi:hypothetical protein